MRTQPNSLAECVAFFKTSHSSLALLSSALSLRDGYRYEQDMTAQISKTSDAKEAQAAFREKRAAIFTGR